MRCVDGPKIQSAGAALFEASSPRRVGALFIIAVAGLRGARLPPGAAPACAGAAEGSITMTQSLCRDNRMA